MRALHLALLLALTACADPQQAQQATKDDPYCVERKDSGKCIAWLFGPTRTQREAFDRRSQR